LNVSLTTKDFILLEKTDPLLLLIFLSRERQEVFLSYFLFFTTSIAGCVLMKKEDQVVQNKSKIALQNCFAGWKWLNPERTSSSMSLFVSS